MPFKRVLLGCFALQRLIVWIAMSISFYYQPAEALLMSTYQAYSPGLFIGSIIVFLTLLGVLYFLRRKRILKWLVLLIFSTAEAAAWIGFDALVHTNVRYFNCSFTLAWVLLVWLFDEIRGGKQSKIVDTTPVSMKRASSIGAWIDPINDPGTLPRIYGAGNYEFLKIHIDGSIAFVLVGVTSAVLFTVYRFLPVMDYGMSFIFQFVLITWFALDLRRLDRILGNDEASQGVIYVYIDAVLAVGYVTMVAAAVGAMVFFIAGFVMSGPAAKGISGGCAGCGGCANCGECNWTLFSDSKCLFFNEEGSSFECCESSPDDMPTIADLRKRRSDLDQGMERV